MTKTTSESASLSYYLQRLDKEDLLTKEEEGAFAKNIEVLQDRILHECVRYSFFREELIQVLSREPIDDENIINLSRKLDFNSKPQDIEIIQKNWISLLELLNTQGPTRSVKSHLRKISLSGNLINTLVLRLKKKYDRIRSSSAKLNKLKAYFKCRDLYRLNNLMEKIKDDQDTRRQWTQKKGVRESEIFSKTHDFAQLKSELSSLASAGLGVADLEVASKIYASIVKNEHEMKQYKDVLVSRNLRLVVARARNFTGKGLEMDDLIQEGNLGLIRAIDKYDLSRGTKISTHATWWIDQAIKRAISNTSRTVRIPTHIEFMQSKLATAATELHHELQRAPTTKELSERSEIAEAKIEGLKDRAMHKVGMDDDLGRGLTLTETLTCDATQDPLEIVARKDVRARVRQIISHLDAQTEKIIRLRFGIGEPMEEERTLKEVARELGMGRVKARNETKKAFAKILKFQPELKG